MLSKIEINSYIKDDYYQYAQPNDKLPAVKRAFLRAKQEMRGLQMHLPHWFWLSAEISNNLAWPMRIKLRIPEDTISMPKLVRICICSLCSSVELEILFQNGRSAFF